MEPKITIIIPTLNRAETLYFTISTALNQDYENYEIIVSDNYSEDKTKAIVSSFNSSKIKYINPQKRLSMSKHWEFALNHVNEGYVTILGDDDGILPNKLKILSRLILKYKIDVIGWRFGNFNWKGLPPYFMIPMSNHYSIIKSSTEINKIINKESIYNTIKFPSFYGGCINIELYKKIKDNLGGVFFHSRIPDFFSGAVFAANVTEYIRVEYPITINATSKFSTGYAAINNNSKSNTSAFKDLQLGNDNLPFLENLIFIRSNAIPIAEAMLQVNKLYPNFKKVDLKILINEVANELKFETDKSKFIDIYNGLIEIGEKNNLKEFTTNLLKPIVFFEKSIETQIKHKYAPTTSTLYIDTSEKNIETVEDAVNSANQIVSNNIFNKNILPLYLLKLFYFTKFFINYIFSKKLKLLYLK